MQVLFYYSWQTMLKTSPLRVLMCKLTPEKCVELNSPLCKHVSLVWLHLLLSTFLHKLTSNQMKWMPCSWWMLCLLLALVKNVMMPFYHSSASLFSHCVTLTVTCAPLWEGTVLFCETTSALRSGELQKCFLVQVFCQTVNSSKISAMNAMVSMSVHLLFW